MNGQLVNHIFVFLFLCAVGAWGVMAYNILFIMLELKRAWEDGEADDVPRGGRGVPLVVLFTDRLPNVSTERRNFVRAFCVFFGCIAVMFAVGESATLLGIKW